MTEKSDPEVDWETTTWKGSRLAQHRAFLVLPFSKKLEALEELADFARQVFDERKRQGLPCVDPRTQQVYPAREPNVAEEHGEYGDREE